MAYGLAVGAAGLPGGAGGDPDSVALAGLGLSLVLVPVALGLAAFVSGREDAPIGLLAGMGLAIGVGLPSLAFRNPLASLIVGLAAGAVVTVSRPRHTRWYARAVGAAVVSALVLAGMMVAFVPTAVIAPALPFTAAGIADLFARRDPWASEEGDDA